MPSSWVYALGWSWLGAQQVHARTSASMRHCKFQCCHEGPGRQGQAVADMTMGLKRLPPKDNLGLQDSSKPAVNLLTFLPCSQDRQSSGQRCFSWCNRCSRLPCPTLKFHHWSWSAVGIISATWGSHPSQHHHLQHGLDVCAWLGGGGHGVQLEVFLDSMVFRASLMPGCNVASAGFEHSQTQIKPN